MTAGDSGAVASDDFFAVVRRRHPDIDIVLLPQQPPDQDPGLPVEPPTWATYPLASTPR